VNCCDEYGNCRQGRDCPVRMRKGSDVEPKEDVVLYLFVAMIILCVVGMIGIFVK
jgi:hypothetical protein